MLLRKLQAADELLAIDDFVPTHFNGSDEAAHRQQMQAKREFIRKVYACLPV